MPLSLPAALESWLRCFAKEKKQSIKKSLESHSKVCMGKFNPKGILKIMEVVV